MLCTFDVKLARNLGEIAPNFYFEWPENFKQIRVSVWTLDSVEATWRLLHVLTSADSKFCQWPKQLTKNNSFVAVWRQTAFQLWWQNSANHTLEKKYYPAYQWVVSE